MVQKKIEANLAMVEAHFGSEADGRVDEAVGLYTDDIIWEAPRQHQQASLIIRCGSNVNLGNILPRDVLGLEALRRGLRYETLSHFAPELNVENE